MSKSNFSISSIIITSVIVIPFTFVLICAVQAGAAANMTKHVSNGLTELNIRMDSEVPKGCFAKQAVYVEGNPLSETPLAVVQCQGFDVVTTTSVVQNGRSWRYGAEAKIDATLDLFKLKERKLPESVTKTNLPDSCYFEKQGPRIRHVYCKALVS